jgi:hypothetical protein
MFCPKRIPFLERERESYKRIPFLRERERERERELQKNKFYVLGSYCGCSAKPNLEHCISRVKS